MRERPIAPDAPDCDLSVVVPFYNEMDSVDGLYREIKAALADSGTDHEFVFVNDGSRDDTQAHLDAIAAKDNRVKVVSLLRNYGQTAAMVAGFDHATGAVIVTLDGDGQNDPADIPRLLAELDKGVDVVCGWRVDRQDVALTRKLPSAAANWLISKVSGVKLHDYGCSLKAYRRDIIRGVRLYGEMHRFIPIYTAWQGGQMAEIPVNHRPRRHGQSNHAYPVVTHTH